MKIIRPLVLGLLCVLVSSTASAQGATSDTRPGSNTIFGDTGLWFVPTGETVPKGTWSGSIALVNFDRSEGFSDITNCPLVRICTKYSFMVELQSAARVYERESKFEVYNSVYNLLQKFSK